MVVDEDDHGQNHFMQMAIEMITKHIAHDDDYDHDQADMSTHFDAGHMPLTPGTV